MQTRKRLAYIGGGSMFVPSIINGIAEVMRNSPSSYGVELALYDVQPAKAERMQAYAELVSTTWRVPLQAVVSRTRQEALIDADVVLLSVWLHDVHERLEQVLKGVDLHMEEDGLGVVAWALACAPWSLGVAADMKQLCPEALLLTLMNPTDVIAGVVTEATGIRAAGLCVEVDGLRGVLAYTQSAQAKRSATVNALTVLLGLFAARPSLAGAGMLAGARQRVFLPWEDVRRVHYEPERRTIMLRAAGQGPIALFCDEANYQQVEQAVRRHTA